MARLLVLLTGRPSQRRLARHNWRSGKLFRRFPRRQSGPQKISSLELSLYCPSHPQGISRTVDSRLSERYHATNDSLPASPRSQEIGPCVLS
jgi:hypothetical protein